MSHRNEKINWPWILIGGVFLTVAGAYVICFYNFPWSKNPSNWGVIGDYFGGILNPLISTLTLFFLIKAYISQKEELKETVRALSDTANHNKEIAAAQKEILENQVKQSIINREAMRIQCLTAQINASYKKIEFFHKEVDRITEAIARNVIFRTYDSKELRDYDTQDAYRRDLLNKLKVELASSDIILEHLNELL